MNKIRIGSQNCLYPMPVILAGTVYRGKPNFITVAHLGIADLNTVSISVNKEHCSCGAISRNGAFSINVPVEKMLQKVDFCGMVSGEKFDKSSLFDCFYGELENAPLIRECPINMECRLVKTLDIGNHSIFFGRIEASHADGDIVAEGSADCAGLGQILYMMNDRGYYSVGKKIGKAWTEGENLMNRVESAMHGEK